MDPRLTIGHVWRFAGLLVLLCGCLGTSAWAQTDTGGIEGVARDASGGVLPGVSVVITSPALIERTREATTEATGNYRFLRLPVGAYTVTFSLAGFSTVSRGNVVINSGFTATINGELGIGSLNETLTVTGEAPIVDVRTTTGQFVVTSEVVNTIPTSRNIMDIGKLMVGFATGVPEVGGSRSQNYGDGWQIHGNRPNDRSYFRDGLPSSSYFSGGDAPMSYGATGANEEVNYQTTAIPASVGQGGMAMMLVTKSGGNRFSGGVFASGSNNELQSSNLTDRLRSRGVRATSGMQKAYDIDSSIGGPIKKDKIWFFFDVRIWEFTDLLGNQFNQDGSQLQSYERRNDEFGKVTWQLNRSNKLTVSDSREAIFRPFRRQGATFVLNEASNFNTQTPFNHFAAATWTSTISSSWLSEIRASNMDLTNRERYRPEVLPNARSRNDITNSILSGAPTRIREGHPYRTVMSGAVTHVGNFSGNHELNVGGQYDFGGYQTIQDYREHGDIYLRLRGTVPDSVDLLNSPINSDNKARMGALYVQDRWMVANRLTINAGLRYDHIYIYFPEQHAEAGAWVPERTVAAQDVQTWDSVVPRLGVAFDLTGAAKTVLKGSFSTYMGNEGVGLAETLNPIFLQTNRCVWRDLNSDLDAQPAEISACAGWSGGTTTTVDPELRRPFNREYSLGVDHQLAANLRVSVVYNRRENLDNRTTINRAVPTNSYIPITINNPLTNTPLTIYNQNPATVGRQDNLLTNSEALNSHYDGVDISFQRRFGPGSVIQGGYSYGKTLGRTSSADPSDPNNDIFTQGAIGSDQPQQFKISGSHLLPGLITVSGAFSANTGLPRQTTLSVGRALVPALTRATQNVNLEPNDVNRYEKWAQLDMRIGRPFKVRGLKLEPFVDGYNLLNASTILTDVTTFGPSLGTISTTINPRMVRIGGKLNF